MFAAFRLGGRDSEVMELRFGGGRLWGWIGYCGVVLAAPAWASLGQCGIYESSTYKFTGLFFGRKLGEKRKHWGFDVNHLYLCYCWLLIKVIRPLRAVLNSEANVKGLDRFRHDAVELGNLTMTVLRGTMGATADGRGLLVQKDGSEGLPAPRLVGYVTRRFQENSVEAGHDDSSIRLMA